MSQHSPLTIQFALVHYWSNTPQLELGVSYSSESGQSILAWMHAEGLLKNGQATDRLRVWVTEGLCEVPLPVASWQIPGRWPPPPPPVDGPVCVVGPSLGEPRLTKCGWEIAVADIGQWVGEGLSRPFYQWQREQVDIVGAEGDSLVFSPPRGTRDNYRCMVIRRNAAGETWAYTPEVLLP